MVALLVVFFLVSIVFSFLCSLWEASLLTIPPSYVEARSQEGTRVGRILKDFKENVDRPLAAILTLNTIAHTVGAIGVGAQATKIWPGNELVTGAIVPVVMTLAILILSEIIPKTIGATYWKRLAPFTARTLSVTIAALYPLVWLSQRITKLLKGSGGHGATMSRTDMAALATLSEREGVIESSESRMMQNLLRAREVKVSDIMTPRTVLVAAPRTQTIDEFLGSREELPFSRIPLYGESIDQVEGYALKDTLLLAALRGGGADPLHAYERRLLRVDHEASMPMVFDRLVAAREHIALVLGEFGGTAGIVTQEDVIETLFGLEIVDESDDTEDMQALARRFRDERRERAGSALILTEDGETTLDVSGAGAEVEASAHEASGGGDIGLTGESRPTPM